MTIYWVMIVLAVILISDGIIFWLLRKKYEKSLDITSLIIGNILNGKKELVVPEHQDLLPSKIQHQLGRLQSMMDGCNEEIRRDRDDIRRLIADIAHQLRTPLANMETYLELLQGEGLTEKKMACYTDALQVSMGKLDFLVGSFVKMSRLEQKVIQIRREDKDLCLTVANALFQVGKQAREKNINLEFTWKENREVPHDGNWLGEAVYNLLDNAVKYSERDSKVEIRLVANEMFAGILVRDYGLGIEKGEEAEIFRRFYRGKRVTCQEGFGIGLYVAREIVVRHEGFMKVGRMEKGTRFEIHLPF